MNRINLLKKYVEGKKVLDIGCIQHSWKNYKKKDWLHRELKNVTLELTGLDYLKEDAKKLREKSFNIVYGNAENFNLKKKFEVIVAAELIEHLFNVGNFLDSVKKHMNKNSLLLITTPNAHSLGNIFRIIKLSFGSNTKDNPEHTHWYDLQTMKQTLERKEFKIIELKTFNPDRYKSRIFNFIPKKVRAKIFCVAKLR